MSSEEETRVMPLPAELRSLMMGPTPSPDAETPCVGVPSVGDTHFEQTRMVPAGGMIAAPVQLSKPSVRIASETTGTSSPKRPRRRDTRVPRPVALLVGAAVGIFAALSFGLFQQEDAERQVLAAPTTRIEVLVETEEGAGVPNLPVRVRNQVVLTDEEGRAPFPPVEIDSELRVEAACPNGYTGGRLSREIPRAVAAASKAWSFRLVCRPEFSDVSFLVETKGCGEMRVWVDGVESGTTSGGRLTLHRRIQKAEVLEVKAEPTAGPCEFENVRHLSLAPEVTNAHVLFEGKPPRPVVRARQKAAVAPARPYRL